jgi:hypothetical protein
MAADDLEVIGLDADVEPDVQVDVGGGRRDDKQRDGRLAFSVAAALLALLGVVGLSIDDLGSRSRAKKTEVALAAARRDAKREAAEADVARRARDLVAEQDRAAMRLREAAKFDVESELSSRGTRELIVDRRARRWCQASDLRVTGGDTGFILFANVSGHECALADHPILLSPQGDGYWNPVPTFPSLENSYSDGPAWTGVFDPRFTAVLSIAPSPLNPNLGVCVTGRGPDVPYGPLALQLRAGDGRLDLPNASLPHSPCRPILRLWSYDSTDR